MIDKRKEAELFDYLCRHKPLREWLEQQLGEQAKVLMLNQDIDAIWRAQGTARAYQSLLDRLAAAEQKFRN